MYPDVVSGPHAFAHMHTLTHLPLPRPWHRPDTHWMEHPIAVERLFAQMIQAVEVNTASGLPVPMTPTPTALMSPRGFPSMVATTTAAGRKKVRRFTQQLRLDAWCRPWTLNGRPLRGAIGCQRSSIVVYH